MIYDPESKLINFKKETEFTRFIENKLNGERELNELIFKNSREGIESYFNMCLSISNHIDRNKCFNFALRCGDIFNDILIHIN